MKEKAIFIGSYSPSQIYAANKLFEEGVISSVIFEDGKSICITNDTRSFKLNPKYYYQKFLWGNQNFHNERILKSNYKNLHEKINFYKVKSINSKIALSKIKELNPSLIIVQGTRIIKNKILQSICCDFINIQWGLSPYYGVDGIVTPIYFKNWERIGFTIHKLDGEIESREIVCTDKIEIDENDNYYSK